MGVSGKRRCTLAPPSTPLRIVPTVEIAARHEIDPFEQGDFAQLCGLLAPLNCIGLALHRAAPLSRANNRKLFEAGADLLHSKAGGTAALTSGMGTRRCHQIARCMAERVSNSTITVEVQRPEFDAEPTTEDILTWIEASVAAGMPVLLRLKGGTLDHFSVCAGITPTKVLLHDSAGLRFVKRRSVEGPDGLYRIPARSLLRIAVRQRGG
jgi:hypothetical protein